MRGERSLDSGSSRLFAEGRSRIERPVTDYPSLPAKNPLIPKRAGERSETFAVRTDFIRSHSPTNRSFLMIYSLWSLENDLRPRSDPPAEFRAVT